MQWVFLAMAIVTEVGATLSMRAATTGRKAWYAVVVVGYVAAFSLLSLALAEGLGLGVAYGIWAAAGVALTAVASRFLFREPLTLLMSAGITLIIGGVLLIELGGAH